MLAGVDISNKTDFLNSTGVFSELIYKQNDSEDLERMEIEPLYGAIFAHNLDGVQTELSKPNITRGKINLIWKKYGYTALYAAVSTAGTGSGYAAVDLRHY